MPKVLRCGACYARLFPVDADQYPVAGGPCPHCGANDWIREQVVEIEQVVEVELAMPIEPVAQRRAGTFDRVGIEPAIDWPTDDELDQLEVHSDSIVAGLFMHAPGPDQPDDHWIIELMIQGAWDHTFRIGTTSEDGILDAAMRVSKYASTWSAARRKRNRGEDDT